MIIVNTTFYVSAAIETAFLAWLKDSYLADTTLTSPSVARILGATEEGVSAFAVKLNAPTMLEADAWIEGESALLLNALALKYGEQVLHFTTMMEEMAL